jgi:hypothetical protein
LPGYAKVKAESWRIGIIGRWIMELSEKEKKVYDRITKFDKNWKTISLVGKIAMGFSLCFIMLGVYIFVMIIPHFGGLKTGVSEDLKIAYMLWCYTFILLGLSTLVTGYTLVHYCNDVHFLFNLNRQGEDTSHQKVVS